MKILEQYGYVYFKHLSTGGQGTVHLVQKGDDVLIAKIVDRLNDEALGLLWQIANLRIPNTPQIHEIINTDSETIIIREYIDGRTLFEILEQDGPLDIKRAKAAMLSICETLKAFHEAKPYPIIYRDLKPDNIIITPDDKIYIIDFGIVRYYRQETVRDTVAIGTEGYTAPEIMAGMQSDARSDIYSAGLVLYEMLTGKSLLDPPYQIRPVREADKSLPKWLDALIEKATGMSAVTRFKDVDAFRNALINPRMMYKKKRLCRLAAAILILVCAAGIGLSVWYIFPAAQTKSQDKYVTVLDLEFEDASDTVWMSYFDNPEEKHWLADGNLVLNCEAMVDYPMENGMLVHYRLKSGANDAGAVSLGAYRMNLGVDFETLYEKEALGETYTTWSLDLSGLAFKNTGQYIDYIFYTTPEDDIIYAIAIDQDAGRIAYTAYQIPEETADPPLFLAVYYFNKENEGLYFDSIHIAEGSLKGYLADNFAVYNENIDRMNELFDKGPEDFAEMTFTKM